MYQCSSCGKRYSRKYCLTRHQTTECRRRKDTGKVTASKNEMAKTLSISAEKPHTKKEQEQFAQETTERPECSPNVQLSLSDSESDSDSIPDNPEEVKALFRKLYRKPHHNIERFSKLILLLDELLHMGCLTKEEYDEMNNNLQKKIGML